MSERRHRPQQNYPKIPKIAQTARLLLSLDQAVLKVFPKLKPERLENWKSEEFPQTGLAPDFVLFLTYICGLQFRTGGPRLAGVQSELWATFTGHPVKMKSEIAELLIEALTPALARSVERRGWEKGYPAGPRKRGKGRPPTARGVWAASVLTEEWLEEEKVDRSLSRWVTNQFVSIIQGRNKIGADEIGYFKKQIPNVIRKNLLRELKEQYEVWMKENAVMLQDRQPPKRHVKKVKQWKERNGGLEQVVNRVDAAPMHISHELWDPFWHAASK